MSDLIEDLPPIPGYVWRPMRLGDATALHHFEIACSKLDGATHLMSQADWQQKLADQAYAAAHSIVAVGESGKIAASGWIGYQSEVHEIQAFLDGRVHPQFRGRGLGGFLLRWLERRALQHMAPMAEGRLQVLRILFYDRAPDAIQLYEAHGYQFQYAEEEMQRDLQAPIPAHPLLPSMSFHPWTAAGATEFYQVYEEAFRTRTRFTINQSAWQFHFANQEDGEFQPDLSLLVKDGDQPVAYAICHRSSQGEGESPASAWVQQMGVHPGWRRRGIGSALLAETMRRLAAAGHRHALLSVNVDNPQARSLYQYLGFEPTKRFTLYRKEVHAGDDELSPRQTR